jgi:hypothetical protein
MGSIYRSYFNDLLNRFGLDWVKSNELQIFKKIGGNLIKTVYLHPQKRPRGATE